MYFEQNLKLLAERWPDLAQQLASAADPAEVRWVSGVPDPTLQVDGIHLSSCYDRLRDAGIQAELVPAGSSRAHVYGLATGDLPRLLLSRPEMQQLSVVVMNLAAARASLKYLEHGDWLTDPRVSLCYGRGMRELQAPFACAPASLYLADEDAARLRDLLQLELATPYIRELHKKRRGWYLKRFADNESYLAKDGDVAELFDAFPGENIVIAAAGPTLADQFQWLAANRAGYRLIAVDVAVRSLLQHEIIPDVVVSIDSSPNLFAKAFADIPAGRLAATTLVYSPFSFKTMLDYWPARRVVAYAAGEIFKEIGRKYHHSSLFSSGSVLHPAVDLGVKMGAARILLAGADFAYPKQRSHVAGAGLALDIAKEQNWVLNGRGERVKTSMNFRGYLRDLESYLQSQPGVRFYNASLEGAKIEGTEFWDGGI